YHPPCTLQHGQQLRGGVEAALRELGFRIACAPTDSHLCCGSAGTYSVLQPELAKQLRDRKLAALAPLQAAEPPADKPGRAPRAAAIRKPPTRRR
ncbi:heterodisulfide reductase-related iron-sulfur binding cluster, partial [Escherichia coli]|uniref:heterodisulfide reductase-related iron-sulfur binding cluster n=1 Tax=Escherichia coli TaxID=562 RepID=UPI001170B08A